MSHKKIFLFIIFYLISICIGYAQIDSTSTNNSELTIEKIMQDPKWIGSSPGRVFWSEDSKWVYFWWNPEQAESDSLYVLSRNGRTPRKVTIAEQLKMPAQRGEYNRKRTKKLYEKNGDIFLLHIKSGRIQQLTNTLDRESNPHFTHDEKKITFLRDNNMYLWKMDDGAIVQLTDFRKGRKRSDMNKPGSKQEKWLQQQELKLIQVLRERKEKQERGRETRKAFEVKRPKPIYIHDRRVQNIVLSPDENYVTFVFQKSPKGVKRTVVPDYVTESGFTRDLPGRSKVGAPQSSYEFGIYDCQNDTVYFVATSDIPGIFEQPKYLDEYKKETAVDTTDSTKVKKKSKQKKPRGVYFQGPVWSTDGKRAAVAILSQDSKDRWIMVLNVTTGKLSLIDRQHDEAWIGGPGIVGWRRSSSLGWMPDNRRVWFQSEQTGYSHLYTVDVNTGEKKQLTSGNFEIYSPQISADKKYWYFTSNEVHPGERHFYRMAINGGKRVQVTRMIGYNRIYLSPDEKTLAILRSYTNQPWELYLMANKPGAKPRQITHSLREEFKSYPWRDPDVITFKASDGAEVYARLYLPENPQPDRPAVIFVHGAGYLQNAHKWWSSYFREYMFHNFLTDNGYTVLDIDYRGSAGYGRDWRTAIYRNMGGKDLSDQVDGAKYLVQNYGIDPKRIGIYGGSYGGFIALMAMFTKPDMFAAGAALRPVTDWAHYNHSYSADILNIPFQDSLAYARSSPIYHAEGLKGALLICHGMVDRNVHFQDVVRLSQRLIELGKENWEVAIYPVEGHGFREPSSWTDEYKRIFKLFEDNLKEIK